MTDPRLDALRSTFPSWSFPSTTLMELDDYDRAAGYVRVRADDLRLVLSGSGTVQRQEAFLRLSHSIEGTEA